MSTPLPQAFAGAILVLAATACGGRFADDQSVDDVPVATVSSAPTGETRPATVPEDGDTAPTTTIIERVDAQAISPSEDEPQESEASMSPAMTADEIAELEAELDAIDAFLASLDSSLEDN